jgi:pimeloyl-ACP methyl ester carboxylesterase
MSLPVIHTDPIRKVLSVPADDVVVEGELVVPDGATGLVLFSHGSGSSRFSPRNNYVARQLQDEGLSTFLFDLLTREEDADFAQRFNISLLARRLIHVTLWLEQRKEVKDLPIGYFGASTGAASALIAASKLPGSIRAIVSRGGRPDLARVYLPSVTAPTLLLVGELDTEVIQLNEEAYSELECIKQLKIVKGASHLFEEPGTLEAVARLSAEWFTRHLIR